MYCIDAMTNLEKGRKFDLSIKTVAFFYFVSQLFDSVQVVFSDHVVADENSGMQSQNTELKESIQLHIWVIIICGFVTSDPFHLIQC